MVTIVHIWVVGGEDKRFGVYAIGSWKKFQVLLLILGRFLCSHMN